MITVRELRQLISETKQASLIEDPSYVFDVVQRWYNAADVKRKELVTLAQVFPFQGPAYRVAEPGKSVSPPRSWCKNIIGIKRYSRMVDLTEDEVVMKATVVGFDVSMCAQFAKKLAKSSMIEVDEVIRINEVIALVEPNDVTQIGTVNEDGDLVLD